MSIVVASFCVIQWMRQVDITIPGSNLTGLLKKYISRTQNLTLVYALPFDEDAFSLPNITLPQWQHMYIALAMSYLFQAPHLRQSWYSRWGHLLGHISYPDLENPYLESLMVCDEDMFSMYPVPIGSTDWVKPDYSSCDVFKVRVKLDEFTAAGRISLEFCQYSPPGVARFFEIDPTVNQSLQKLFDRMDIWDACVYCAEHMVPILNQHLDRLAPAEIGQFISGRSLTSEFHSSNCVWARVIYSGGEFRFVGEEGRNAWETQLKASRRMYDGGDEGDEEPGKGSDPDPILREIVKHLEPIWQEQDRRTLGGY
ncbi:hypothetical protein PV04_10027 [Phialophora macrospora]|uniref:Uncharacterized protein n=1 Tax=Phialophora macrospora TaxID=1851006 RepID=A0A0D2FSX6_9EURO|nr:hypothetical protein PV04_10027 [Phialophora macrospora]